jgi:predicted DNA-binding transcriptional regulator AlpA
MTRFYRPHIFYQMTTLSESTVKRREKDDPDFPRRHRISRRRVVYNADEVDDWMHRHLNP